MSERARIEIGCKTYEVGISDLRHWTSSDGEIVRDYIEISEPGIYEVRSAYIERTPGRVRYDETRVETDAGTIIWAAMPGTSGKKIAAINEWFKAVFSDGNQGTE